MGIDGGDIVNKRQSDILNRLIHEETPVTGNELARTYLVSTKTIYNDIVVLNEFLKPYSSSVVKKPSAGIFLEMDEEHRHQLMEKFQVKMESKANKEEFKMLSTFLLDNEVDILDWSLENFTSESSIRREVTEFEKELNANGVMLEKRHGKLILGGAEDQIRKFFRNKLLSGVTHYNLDEMNQTGCVGDGRIQELNQIMNQQLKQYQFSVAHDYRHYLLLDLLIFDIRCHRDYRVEQYKQLDSNSPKIIETYLLARDLLNEITGQEVEEAEIVTLSQILISIGNYASVYLGSDPKIEKTTDAFINMVGDLAGIQLQEDEYLRGMLLNHLPAMIMRLRNRIHLKSNLIEDIKYNFVWLSGKIFKENYNVELTDIEAALLTIHLEIAVEKINQPMKIYVVCPHSLATSELILNQVRKVTGQYDNIEKVSYDKAKMLSIQPNDLVISSVALEDVSYPYIHVGTIMKEEDLLKIQKKFLTHTMGQSQANYLLKDDEEMTKRLIKRLIGNSIYLKKKAGDAEKCLSKIIKLASVDNLKNPRFEKTIRHRENLGITSTYTGIALPHANPKEVTTSELVMMTLDKPVYWGQNLVKVVMLIAIAETELEIYKDALKVLYSKIDSSSYIQHLWEAENQESFLTALFAEAEFEPKKYSKERRNFQQDCNSKKQQLQFHTRIVST